LQCLEKEEDLPPNWQIDDQIIPPQSKGILFKALFQSQTLKIGPQIASLFFMPLTQESIMITKFFSGSQLAYRRTFFLESQSTWLAFSSKDEFAQCRHE
jgi:hypothetical protein